MDKAPKHRKRCPHGTKRMCACCIKRTVVDEVSLRPEVSKAVAQLASRLRFRQQMIREAVVAGNEVVSEIRKQIARRDAQE